MVIRSNALIIYSRACLCVMSIKKFVIDMLPRTAPHAENFADKYGPGYNCEGKCSNMFWYLKYFL